MQKRTTDRIVLLYGGRSAEHDISCVSALHALRAIDTARYEVVAVGIDRTGAWFRDDTALETARTEPPPHALRLTEVPTTPDEVFGDADTRARTVVWPMLHGPGGEDGSIQGLIESFGLPYVGSGVLGSAVSLDKSVAKALVDASPVPQCAWMTVTAAHDLSEAARRATERFGFPMFVKPANLGSSIGITKVHRAEELPDAIETALSYDDVLVIEEGVTAREIEVAVLGNAVGGEPPRAALPGEIVTGDDFYDYTEKYVTDTATLAIPAPLGDEEIARVQALAVEAYEVLRCDGLARVDFFYEDPGRGWLLNEVNTMPGFTPISMYARMWAASGLDTPTLVETLLHLAVARHERRATFSTSH